MKLFQWVMAVFSRLLPARASRMGLSVLTTPRVKGVERGDWRAPDHIQPVGDRARLEIWSGGPRRVLLVHGWSGHTSQFYPLMKAMGSAQHTFYVLQLPGHHEEPDGRSHVGEFIATIREAVRLIGQPLDLAIGHSMGGGALGYLLAESKDIRRAVLIAAPAGFQSLVGRLADFLHFGPRARQQLLDGMERRVGIGYADLDIARRSESIGIPVLLVHDVRDREIPFEDALRLHQAMPHGQLFQTEGAGHKRILSDKRVLNRVADFFGEEEVSREVLRVPA